MATIKKEGNIIYIQHMDKMRKVGEIMVTGNWNPVDPPQNSFSTLRVERTRSEHLMNVWQAYGFAKEVMDHDDWFDYVQIDERNGKENNIYMLPRKDLVVLGREYESDNFERQYFVKLEYLQKYKV